MHQGSTISEQCPFEFGALSDPPAICHQATVQADPIFQLLPFRCMVPVFICTFLIYVMSLRSDYGLNDATQFTLSTFALALESSSRPGTNCGRRCAIGPSIKHSHLCLVPK